MLEEQEWLMYSSSLQQPARRLLRGVGADCGSHHEADAADEMLDANDRLPVARGRSGSQLQLRHNSLLSPDNMRPFLSNSSTSLNLEAAAAVSPHMQQVMNIPNFSSLFDSSLSSCTNLTAPVILTNDIDKKDFLGCGQQQRTPFLGMAAAGECAPAERPHADGYGSSTPAMLQLLTALNESGDSASAHLSTRGDYYGPASATLNFFQGTEAAAHSARTSHHATDTTLLEALDHNLMVQHGHAISGIHEKLGAGSSAHHDFLSLFNKDLECFDLRSSTAAASYLQLQPLQVHPSVGSPPTLFQKRAAQRRLLPSIVPPQASSSTSTFRNKASTTAAIVSTPPSFAASDQGRQYKDLMPGKLSVHDHSLVAGGATFSSSFHQLGCAGQQDGSSLQAVNDGADNFLAEDEDSDQYHAANDFPGPDIQFGLRRDAQQDENCEALFHLHDVAEMQMLDPVHSGSALQEMQADDDELLLGSATGEALQLAASANEQQPHMINDTVNKAARGRVKGPPAKNLMAERRRRKKLNDRLYTLRSVVPKISKMDRASILGDAIEYLKELLQRINDLHNELEASSVTAPMTTPNASFTNQSSCLTPTSTTANLPVAPFVKLEDCPSTTTQTLMQSMAAGSDPPEPPKIEVRAREGRALNIHMFCCKRPGLLLATMRALDELGLDVQQAVISCFNGFALDVFRAEQSQEEDVQAEEIKKVLLFTATSAAPASASTSC